MPKFKITLDQLEGKTIEDLDALFDEMEGTTDAQAYDSDIGGDSDCEDAIFYVQPRAALARTLRNDGAGPSNEVCSFAGDECEEVVFPSESPVDEERSDNANYIDVEELQLIQEVIIEQAEQLLQSELEEVDPPEWSKKATGTSNEVFRRSVFNEPYGPKGLVDIANPLAVFLSFFTVEMVNTIITESERYASNPPPKGPPKTTLNLEYDEFLAYLGILIIMGFHKLPSLRHYWSAKPNFRVERIASVMSLKRFLKITRYLHLNDNAMCVQQRNEPGFDRLFKVRPLINHLKNRFLNSFNPSRFLALDESMIAFKGRSSMKQYLPLKPIKRGFKVWALCCSKSGYLLNFDVYEGKPQNAPQTSLGERVVFTLMEPFKYKNYCLFFDRFYTSISLVLKLVRVAVFACGTVLTSRRWFPHMRLKGEKELKYGQSDFVSAKNVGVSRWKDRGTKCVNVVSSIDNPKKTKTIKRKNNEGKKVGVTCPSPIARYNEHMGGVDRFDQYMETYNIAWKSRRWWVKIFYYLVDASIVNSYILTKETTHLSSDRRKPISQLEFRDLLANQLIGDFCSRKQQTPTIIIGRNKMKNSSKIAVPLTNVTNMHMPKRIDKYRRCGGCSTKNKPKRSNVICVTCGVALCKLCYTPFHEKKSLLQ